MSRYPRIQTTSPSTDNTTTPIGWSYLSKNQKNNILNMGFHSEKEKMASWRHSHTFQKQVIMEQIGKIK